MAEEGEPARLAWNTRTLSAAAAVDSSAPWRMEMLGYESTSLTRDSTNPVAAPASATPPSPRPTPRKEPPRLLERARCATCRGEPLPPTIKAPPSPTSGEQQHVTVPSVYAPHAPPRAPRGCSGRLHLSILGSCAHWRRASERAPFQRTRTQPFNSKLGPEVSVDPTASVHFTGCKPTGMMNGCLL